MKERFAGLLNEVGVKEYRIQSIKEESVELFFIKKKLDMRRIKDKTDIIITIFKPMEEKGVKYKGSSEILGCLSMTDEEWLEKIKGGYFSAGFVKNKSYELPSAIKSDKIKVKSDLSEMDLTDIADSFAKAVYEADNDKEGFINSFEAFAVRRNVSIWASNGTEVSYEKTNFKGEFVIQCKEPVDVETYQDFDYDSLELEDIKELVKRTITLTRDRAKARLVPTTGNYDVVLSHKYLPEIFKLYMDRANAAYVYAGYSEYKTGDMLQGDDVKGDLLNIDFLATVPFDFEGVKMTDRPFIKEGKLQMLHGDVRFSDYLGIEKVGTYSKISIPQGKVSFKEMLSKPCLHIVNFSDFQMDSLDGHFKGEIRLGYLYDKEGNVTLVTGGAVNGSMFDAQKNLVFSEEVQKLSNYTGPVAAVLHNVSIAGK